ncbi:hypothetical protein BKA80DRAFT_287015 [Phyllosticta citrichinensis]
MPWVTINGEQKKVACGPCIRGHRSTSCNHKDRLLLEVRKPGRPLSSCPHLGGNCSCERLVINYTIPRSSECACPNGSSAAPVAEPVVTTAAGVNGAAGGRIQKPKARRSVSSRNPATLEKAIKATEEEPKSCCSKRSSPSTRASSDEQDSPTPSHEDKTIFQPKANPETERPLNVQLEARKEINFTPVTQVNGWNHTTLKTSGSTTVTQVQPTQGSCCGSKSENTPNPPSHAPVPQPRQERYGYTLSNPPQHQYDPNQSYAFFPTRSHPNERFAPPFSTVASPGVLGYATSGNGFPTFPNYAQWTPGVVQGQGDLMHECTCGDACACLGCPVHPRNETTMKHVREITDFMVNDPIYSNSSSSYPDQRVQYQPVYTDRARTNGHGRARPAMEQSMYSGYGNSGPTTPYSQDLNANSLWNSQRPPAAPPAPASAELQQFGFPDDLQRRPSHPVEYNSSFRYQTGHDSSVPTTSFAPTEMVTSTASDTPVLSPSSFFWQQLELPRCSDFTGACRCGDGCQCVGCLTHGGHDGVALGQTADQSFQQPAKISPKMTVRPQSGGSIDLAVSRGPG